MTWVKLDDQFPRHPKVFAVGDPEALWLHVCGMCFSGALLTDGVIPREVVPTLWPYKNPYDLAAKLVDAGIWHEVDGGYEIHDFLDRNPSRAKVLEERERGKERAKRSRERAANVHPESRRTFSDPTRPDPYTSRGPVDNSRPRLRPVEELRADQGVEGPAAPRDVALDAIRAMKGAK